MKKVIRATAIALAPLALCVPMRAAGGDEARIDYMLECQGCHLPDGGGSTDVPPLRNSVARYLSVPGGREFLVQVPGSALSPLSDAKLAGVLNWIIAEFGPDEFARDARPYNAAEVQRLRRTPLVDVESVRRKLVRKFDEGSL